MSAATSLEDVGEIPDTSVVLQRFSIAFEYPVYFTSGFLDPANPVLAEAITRREPEACHRLAAVVDRGVATAANVRAFARYAHRHAARLALTAPPLVLDGGEAIKNDPAVVASLQHWLHELRIDRQSVLVIVGGGALLDMAGYAAATTHRGVRVVRVPTTVLSQNDSGVGVKNAVNAFGAKNFLGTFAPPFAVINDFDFIERLPPRERIAGMAEAVKVAAIRDRDFFDWLCAHAADLAAFRPQAMRAMIRRCAELHLHHIGTAGDPFEFGSARPLDFGHWAAHKLEILSGHALRHGEAVAIGLALDTAYSAATGLLGPAARDRLCGLLERLGFHLWHAALDQRDGAGRRRVLAGLAEFREHLGGELTITLLAALGRGIEVHAIDDAVMDACIDHLKQRDRMRCNCRMPI